MAAPPEAMRRAPAPGVVVIGRNEGERLRRCLQPLGEAAGQVVYVDSGSSDGSIDLARAMGVEVVRLDAGIPFTAARARNAGFRRLRELAPGLDYVQFFDGDCEPVAGWMRQATTFLDSHRDVAAVFGRLHERHPERSVYNLLCDMEWDVPVGDAAACGGNAMLRVEAFEKLGGYRSDLIAGEEPELCVRLRSAGWRIRRLACDMAVHDAAMTRFAQWWKRSKRAGYAFAAGAWLHGAGPERHAVRESRRAWLWGLGLPLCAFCCAVLLGPGALAVLLLYPLQVLRLALHGKRSARENWWRAAFLVLGKFPEVLGQVGFLADRWLGGRSRLMEYK